MLQACACLVLPWVYKTRTSLVLAISVRLYLVLCARMKLYISMLKMSVFVVFWPAEDVDTWNFVSTLRCLDLNCADLVFDLAVNAMYVISGRCL